MPCPADRLVGASAFLVALLAAAAPGYAATVMDGAVGFKEARTGTSGGGARMVLVPFPQPC